MPAPCSPFPVPRAPLTGAMLRDEGCAATEEANPEFHDLARGVFAEWLNGLPMFATFIFEDFRLEYARRGLPQPGHPNSWGALARAVLLDNPRVRSVPGLRPLQMPRSHARRSPVYQKIP